MAEARLSAAVCRACADDTAAATGLAAAALDLVLDRIDRIDLIDLVDVVGGDAASVLDVGTGAGVLAARARAGGARRVVGIECDALLASAARVGCPDVEVVHVRAEDYLPRLGDAAFDVVVANLPAPLVVDLVPQLARVARRAVIVAGARLWQGRALRQALEQASWPGARALAADGWCAFVARR